jgi:hypothetical protein
MATASLAKFHALQKKVETAQNRIKKIREVADDKVARLVSSTEVAAGGMAIGLLIGKTNKQSWSGIPMGLIGAMTCHGLALAGIGGDMANHLHAFGDGALGAFAGKFGEAIGRASTTGTPMGDAVKQALTAVSGEEPTVSGSLYGHVAGQRLSDAELDALKNR